MKKFIFSLVGFTLIMLSLFSNSAADLAFAIGPMGAMSIRQLEAFSKGELSSFDGDDYDGGDDYDEFESSDDYDEFESIDDYDDAYIGYNDEFVDFGGFNKSFANAGDSGRIFVMTLANAAAVPLTAKLCPGYFWFPGSAADGFVKDGVFPSAEGVGVGTLTGSGSPKLIADFLAFIQYNPTAIGGIKIEGSLAAQVSQQLIIQHLSPFKQLEQKIINLGSYQNENTFRDKIVTVPTNGLVLSNQVSMSLVIPAGCTTVITFLAGGIMNTSHALAQKITKATNNIARIGLPKAKKMKKVIRRKRR